MRFFIVLFTIITSVLFWSPTSASDFKYRKKVTLKIGQSTILKGVRSPGCIDAVPSWQNLKRELPNSNLGTFSDGGSGVVKSNYCKKTVGARGIRFTAQRAGKERLRIFADPVRIIVK